MHGPGLKRRRGLHHRSLHPAIWRRFRAGDRLGRPDPLLQQRPANAGQGLRGHGQKAGPDLEGADDQQHRPDRQHAVPRRWCGPRRAGITPTVSKAAAAASRS